MNKNKVITVGLAIVLSMGVFGCSKKVEEKPNSSTAKKESVVTDNTYSDFYVQQYNDYLLGLNDYVVYETPESRYNMYKDVEYPGNETYVSDIKKAYTDSKEKIQNFVNKLKTDAKTEDKKIKAENDALISEGEKLISEMDARIKRLDEIPKDAYDKTKDEFMKLVDEATKESNNFKSDFNKKLKEMNEKYGVNQK